MGRRATEVTVSASPSGLESFARTSIVTAAEWTAALASIATGGRSVKYMYTVAVLVPPKPSEIVYVKLSVVAVVPLVGVYVTLPSELITAVPCDGVPTEVTVKLSPSGL